MTKKKSGKTMRLAGLLLVLVLVTSCFVGGTFAKYVTSGAGTDSARVAKFGVTVTANGTLFAEEYATDDTNVVGTIAKSVVSSESGKNVVAPGTKGNMVSMSLTGTPEVAVRVSYEATTMELGDNWVDGTGAYYCPLKITVGTDVLDGLTYASADEFENAVKEKIAAYSKDYEAGTDLSTVGTDSLAISWEWPFEDTTTGAKQTNEKDTYLGDQAAADEAGTITLEVKTTVTQID